MKERREEGRKEGRKVPCEIERRPRIVFRRHGTFRTISGRKIKTVRTISEKQ